MAVSSLFARREKSGSSNKTAGRTGLGRAGRVVLLLTRVAGAVFEAASVVSHAIAREVVSPVYSAVNLFSNAWGSHDDRATPDGPIPFASTAYCTNPDCIVVFFNGDQHRACPICSDRGDWLSDYVEVGRPPLKIFAAHYYRCAACLKIFRGAWLGVCRACGSWGIEPLIHRLLPGSPQEIRELYSPWWGNGRYRYRQRMFIDRQPRLIGKIP